MSRRTHPCFWIFLLGILTGVGLARPNFARACAACGCGDPTLTAMGQEKPFKNRVRLSLEHRLGQHASGELSETSLIFRTTLTGSYSPTAWLTFAAALPFVVISNTAAQREARNLAGLGDLELLTRALIFRNRRFSPRHIVGLLAGVKTPTGPRIDDSTGYPAEDDLQPGTGSWDPIFGVNYSYFGTAASTFLSVSYRHATSGYRGYLRGSSLGASLYVQLPFHRRAALILGTDLSYALANRLSDNTLAPDTGGLLVSATPGLLFALHPDWLLRFMLQIPVVERWRGSQHETPSGILALVVDV